MQGYDLVFLSFATFHIIVITDTTEDRNYKWLLGYFMTLINYMLILLFSYHINIPTKEVFIAPDLLMFIPQIFTADAVFYWTHRLFHTKYLYGLHKQHHEWNEPVSASFLDAHPVENLLVNIPTVLVPLYLTPVSDFQQGLWVISATINSVVSHMTTFNPDQPHVIHHKLRRYNFGAGGCYLMDKIMGTYKDH
tara:strand:- start:488 stop:1066 length:579 start_codon:yes stop_codon:yes gene_type:complete